jgi:MFS family permease
MVALTFLTTLCASAAVSLPGVLILPVSQEFGWGRGDIAGAIGLMLVLFAGTAPFAGALILRYGLRRAVVAAAVLAMAALLGTTLVAARWQLWLGLGALGVAAGMVALALSATVANRWFGQRRGLAMGVLTAAFAVGQLTFLPLAAWLATNHGWRAAVLPAVLGCGVCAVLYVLLARDWPAELGLAPYGEERVRPPDVAAADSAVVLSFAVLREALPTRVFWVLAGTFFICGLSTTGIVNQHFIPLCADYGVGAVAAASALALMGVFNFAGTIASGWLSDRFDNRVLLAWYYGLRGLSLVWLPFSDFDLLSLSLFAVFFGLDYVATVPPTVKLAAQHFGPAKAPIVFGWAFAAHQLGGALSAAAAGVSRDALATYLPAFLAIGLACLLAALAVFAVRDVRPATAVRATTG